MNGDRLVSHDLVYEVRDEQRRGYRKHGDDSAIGMLPGDSRWLSVLVAEVGEVSAETRRFDHRPRLREELIQVAAVALAWIAALDEDQS